MENEKPPVNTYWSKEVADLLDIGTSTLRKWCLILQDNGYRFLRDEYERRAYTEHDVMALRKMKELTKDKSMTLENASIAVISSFNRSDREERTGSAMPPGTRSESRSVERHEELLERLSDMEERVEMLTDLNKALVKRLDEKDELVKARDQEIMLAIQELKQTRLAIASSSQNHLEDRQQRITDMITMKRIEAQLEREALALWNEKPEHERMVKVGFFRKEEDRSKRDQFVKSYVAEHFEKKTKEEMNWGQGTL